MAKVMSSGFSYLKKAHKNARALFLNAEHQTVNNQSITEKLIEDKEEHK